MRFLNELLSNNDGRFSTTSTIQFFGGLSVLLVLLWACFLDRPYVPDLVDAMLMYLFGSTTAKGVVSTVQQKKEGVNE